MMERIGDILPRVLADIDAKNRRNLRWLGLCENCGDDIAVEKIGHETLCARCRKAGE